MGYIICDHYHLNDLGDEIVKMAIDAGWVPEDGVDRRSFGDLIALAHSELSEALEEYRNGHDFTEVYYNEPPDVGCNTLPNGECISDNCMHTGRLRKPEGIPVELADVLIRLLFTFRIYKIDAEAVVREKLAFNATRGGRYKNDGDHIVGADGKRL